MAIQTQVIRIDSRLTQKLGATVITPGASWGAVTRVKCDAKLKLGEGEFSSGFPFSFRIDPAANRIDVDCHANNHGPTIIDLELTYDDTVPYVTIRSVAKGKKSKVFYTSNASNVPHTGGGTKDVQLVL